jgi:predicted metal-binding protein
VRADFSGAEEKHEYGSPLCAPQEDNHVILRRRRQNIKSHQNWLMLYYQINKDHAQADLIWNHYTREELRQKLEDEYRTFTRDKVYSRAPGPCVFPKENSS